MLYLMPHRINIIIIILLTLIISLKAKQTRANSYRSNDNDSELYGNFTAIEFLKELKHYDTILIMQNRNATISSHFFTHLKNQSVLPGNYNKTIITASANRPGLRVLSEMVVATPRCATFANCLMASIQVPVLQLNELQSFYLKRHYCEHLLSIVYVDINIEGIQMTLNDHKGLLEKLSRNLLHMTTSKVMFLVNFPLVVRRGDGDGDGDGVDDDGVFSTKAAIIDEDVIEGVVRWLFQHCWQQKIINVVALLADYQTTRKFYSYTHFPEFQLEIKPIAPNANEQEEIYPYRLANLKGYKLPIVIGGSDPRIIPYKTSKGKEIIGGFVGHFIEAFAKKYNCVLVQPLPFNPKKPIPSQDLIKAVRNGTVEISAGLTFPEIPFRGYTYGYEQMNGCIMMPVEANIPGYKFFTSVFKGETYLLVIAVIIVISMLLSTALYFHGYRVDYFNILCHGACLRGLLGQSFSEIMNPPKIIRFIYLQICMLGILLTTTYNSYFSTYVTRPPKEPFLNSIDSILWSGLKVVIWEPEYKELLGRAPEFRKYIPIFIVIQNYQEYLQKRDSLNNKYAYLVPTPKWIIVQQQQKMFTTPLFRHSDNFCIFNNIPMCFPVHENSIYNSLLYQLILETAQSGLTEFWSEYGFLELIEAKKLNLKDLSAKEEFRAMTVDDLQYIFVFMGSMLVFVNLVFLAELGTSRKFYTYTHFPEFQLEIKTIALNSKNQTDIYPYRLGNLKGYKLPIVIGGSDPRIIPYNTTKGKEIIGGFVGHFIMAFAKKYNCVLVQPLPFHPHEPIPSQDLIKAVRNGTVELSAGLTFPQIPFIGYSYAYEQLNWCIMIPVEANIPGYMFFTSVFKGDTYVLVIVILIVISMILSAALYLHGYRPDLFDIICHDDCLRGLLGQSFSEIANPPKIIRFIYLQICTLGILLTTTYNSYFSTYVTRPPKEAFLNSFDDILYSGLKVVAWEPEYNELLGRVEEFKKYVPLFYLVEDYQDYLEKRDSFNNKYGYVVPTTKWIIVQEQQKLFTTPLFRQSNNFCFFNNIPMCFPVHENSIFNSLVYQLILETAQSGLTFYWSKYGFMELIAANKLIFKDLSAREEFRAMTVNDLQYILIFLGGMFVVVNLVFMLELLIFYRRSIWKRFRNVFGKKE